MTLLRGSLVRTLLTLLLCGCLAALGCGTRAPSPGGSQPTAANDTSASKPRTSKPKPERVEEKKIEVEPSRVEVKKGGTAKLTLTVRREGGYDGEVALSFDTSSAPGIKIAD